MNISNMSENLGVDVDVDVDVSVGVDDHGNDGILANAAGVQVRSSSSLFVTADDNIEATRTCTDIDDGSMNAKVENIDIEPNSPMTISQPLQAHQSPPQTQSQLQSPDCMQRYPHYPQHQQHHSNHEEQYQQHHQQRENSQVDDSSPGMGVSAAMPMMAPMPFPVQSNNTSNANVIPSFPDPSSFPWAIGTTDGSFAVVNLIRREQELQQKMQQQNQKLSTNSNFNPINNNNNNNNNNNDNGNDNYPSYLLPTEDETNTNTSVNELETENTVDHNDRNLININDKSNSSTTKGQGQGHAVEREVEGGGAAIGTFGEAAAAADVACAQIVDSIATIQSGRSLYHDKLFSQSSSSVEAVLSASCEVMNFDIAEMWLRTGPKTHQLTNSHLRPTSLEDSVRQDLVEVYYGDKSNERTHRLSPALCKRAKDANDVVWVTAHTPNGAEALRMSISNVRTAVAVPVCHDASNTNVTIIYFSIRRIMLRPAAVEFLVHLSLGAAVASVNALSLDGLIDHGGKNDTGTRLDGGTDKNQSMKTEGTNNADGKSLSEHGIPSSKGGGIHRPNSTTAIYHQRPDRTSITGARLDLKWRQLLNVEYLTDGGNSWIHTAIFDGKPVVVKTLRPECQDTAVAINEIEAEVAIHSRLNHPNIASVIGAGWTSKKIRFIVLERLDGGTLTQMLGYDTRIRDRRRRFWRKKQLPYLDVLRCARSLACALQYCQEQAIPGSMVLHRDLKPDNIGFTLDGQVKLIDFGLARILENANPTSDDKYNMSGETGSLRYMAPEVAEGLPYNHKADVYSFGVILWEMNAGKRPFGGLSRNTFYEQVVHGGGRPSLNKKWPSDLIKLISSCWSADIDSRPTFRQIVDNMDDLLINEKTGGGKTFKGGKKLQRLSGIIDRHSTWF